tara:strand:- start:3361 stop:4020 length:660 start_codon:yes stop_codon:yes gene_type:complete
VAGQSGDQGEALATAQADAAESQPAEPADSKPDKPFSVVTDEAVSRITWTSVKDGSAKVSGDFTRIRGGLFLDETDLGSTHGSLTVDLNAIDSKNPVRDANIAQFLFESMPDAPKTARLELRKLSLESNSLAPGESAAARAEFNIALTGGALEGIAEVQLSRASDGRWKVTTAKPIALSLSGLSLSQQSESLRTRCNHQSIDDGVAVSLQLELVPQLAE